MKAGTHWRAFGLWWTTAFRVAPIATTCMAVTGVLQAIAAPLGAYGVGLLVDGLAVDGGPDPVVGMAFVFLGFVGSYLGPGLLVQLETTMHDRMHGWLHRDLLDLVNQVPRLQQLRRSDVADRIMLLRVDARSMSFSGGEIALAFAVVANLGVLLVLLGDIHPVLMFLPALGLVRVWAAASSARRLQDAEERSAGYERRGRALVDVAVDPGHGTEVRSYRIGAWLVDRITEAFRAMRAARMRAIVRGSMLEGVVRAGFACVYVAAIGGTVRLAYGGSATLGQVATLVLLAPQIDQAASGIADAVRNVSVQLRRFGRYHWLRDFVRSRAREESDPRLDPPSELRDGVELERMTFGYPGSSLPALRDIGLRLPVGRTVALVGDNGAGKSTLVKVLIGLYGPTSGRVLVDGRDLEEYATEQWQQRSAVLFQDFVRWQLSVRETVGLGDLARAGDADEVRAALREADADGFVAGLPSGIDQPTGTSGRDGVGLSGGQWQRLALARALFRREPLLLILDEPTSALDPLAEHALFARYVEASRRTGTITVVVSHRLATVRLADHIVVLENGQVLQQGTHDELLRQGGRYAELFDLQARHYR